VDKERKNTSTNAKENAFVNRPGDKKIFTKRQEVSSRGQRHVKDKPIYKLINNKYISSG